MSHVASWNGLDGECVDRSVVHHAEHTLATDRYNFDMSTAYQAVAYSVRDYLVESFRDTKAHYVKEDPKRVYYLSLEFLMGRSLLNSLMNLDLEHPYKEALEEIGFKLEDLVEEHGIASPDEDDALDSREVSLVQIGGGEVDEGLVVVRTVRAALLEGVVQPEALVPQLEVLLEEL